MQKEEIIAGLKSAIERGYSLELAKASFINSGYNQQEVEAAAASLGGIITNYPTAFPHTENKFPQAPQPPKTQLQLKSEQQFQPPQPKPLPEPFIQPPQQPIQITQSINFQPVKKSHTKTIIIVIIIVILALILLSAVAVLAGLVLSPDKTKEIVGQILPFLTAS